MLPADFTTADLHRIQARMASRFNNSPHTDDAIGEILLSLVKKETDVRSANAFFGRAVHTQIAHLSTTPTLRFEFFSLDSPECSADVHDASQDIHPEQFDDELPEWTDALYDALDNYAHYENSNRLVARRAMVILEILEDLAYADTLDLFPSREALNDFVMSEMERRDQAVKVKTFLAALTFLKSKAFDFIPEIHRQRIIKGKNG